MARAAVKRGGKTFKGGWSQNRAGDGKFADGKMNNPKVPAAQKKNFAYQDARAKWHTENVAKMKAKAASATGPDKARYEALAAISAKKVKEHTSAAAKFKKIEEMGKPSPKLSNPDPGEHTKQIDGTPSNGTIYHKNGGKFTIVKKYDNGDVKIRDEEGDHYTIDKHELKSEYSANRKKPIDTPQPKAAASAVKMSSKAKTSFSKMTNYMSEATNSGSDSAGQLKATIAAQKAAKHSKRVMDELKKQGLEDSPAYKTAKATNESAKKFLDDQKKPKTSTFEAKKAPSSGMADGNAVSKHYTKAAGLAITKDYHRSLTHPDATNFDVSEYAAAQKAYSKQLNHIETNSIKHYTGSGYDQINGALRKDGTHPAVKYIDSGLAKSPLEHDMILHRGAGGKEFFEKMKVGDVFEDKGYTSSSAGTKSAFYHKPVQFVITAPKGTKAAPIPSNFGTGEAEMLIGRGTKYRITKMEPNGHDGKFWIHVTIEGQNP